MLNIKQKWNELSYNNKLKFQCLGFIVLTQGACMGAYIDLVLEKKQHFVDHANDLVEIIKKDNDYRFTDTRLEEPVNYNFSIAKNHADSTRMIENGDMFGKVEDGIILTEFKNNNFHEVTRVKNYSIGKVVPASIE